MMLKDSLKDKARVHGMEAGIYKMITLTPSFAVRGEVLNILSFFCLLS